MTRALIAATILLVSSPSARAAQSACDVWVSRTAIGQFAAPNRPNPNSYPSSQLIQAYNQFRLSEHRANPANYAVLIDHLNRLDINLKAQLEAAKTARDTAIATYEKTFTPIRRGLWVGAPSRHYNTHVRPHKNTIKSLESALKTLASIRDSATAAQADVTKNRFAFEAEAIFQLTKDMLGSAVNGLNLAKTLLNQPGDLLPKVNLAKELFDHFKGKYGTVLSGVFATALIGTNRTDVRHIRDIRFRYEQLKSKYPAGVAVGLSILAFKSNLPDAKMQSLHATYDALNRHSGLKEAQTLPIIGSFLVRGRVPTRESVLLISDLRDRLIKRGTLDEPSAAILTSILWVTKGELVLSTDLDRLMAWYEAYSAQPSVQKGEAALLAAASYLVGRESTAHLRATVEIFRRFEKLPGVSRGMAAGMTFKILLTQFGVDSSALASASDMRTVSDEISSGDAGDSSFIMYMLLFDSFSGDSSVGGGFTGDAAGDGGAGGDGGDGGGE